MRFKNFVNEQLIQESAVILNKLKTFEDLSDKIDYKSVDDIFKRVANFLKNCTIKNNPIDEIKKLSSSLYTELNSLHSAFVLCKNELQTNFFDDVTKLCARLVDTVLHHFETQKSLYDNANR